MGGMGGYFLSMRRNDEPIRMGGMGGGVGDGMTSGRLSVRLTNSSSDHCRHGSSVCCLGDCVKKTMS